MTEAESELPALLADRHAYRERLELIVPRNVTGTAATDSPAAGAAAFTFMYVGAVDGQHLLRPSMVLWMCDEVAARRSDDDRLAWYNAAQRSSRAVDLLCEEWGVGQHRWYKENSREGPRDETFRHWKDHGALLVNRSY